MRALGCALVTVALLLLAALAVWVRVAGQVEFPSTPW
jgi:hypothetical protein